ncbi:hypothetical protein [uncultured Xanthomonas sp.]|uniref:hypothetical protein n=1 Tax=uncultured Xanthomonas sp. TaxID=152831 RepID=UPI0025EB56FB|nr:hypothetical protein [uncultured Xanthomonas sp.]
MISCRGFSAWRKAGAAAGGTGADGCGIGSVGCGKRDTIQAGDDAVRLRARLAACERGSAHSGGMAAATQRGSAHAAAMHTAGADGEHLAGGLPTSGKTTAPLDARQVRICLTHSHRRLFLHLVDFAY